MLQDGKRVYAIDLARGLAVLFMILIHVQITYSDAAFQSSALGLIIDFLGDAPAAPVFMALMGISFYYSRNTDFKSGVKRGLYIIFLGYVLNFLRGVMPLWIAAAVSPTAYAAIPPEVTVLKDAILELDILHFAGLALIVMAVLRELKTSKYVLLGLAIAIAIAAPMLWTLGSGIPVLGHFLDYLWGDKPSPVECLGNFVSFPFFPWFSFALLGMFLGDYLTKSGRSLHEAFNRMGIAGAVVIALSLPVLLSNYSYHMGDFYHCRTVAVVFMAGFIMAWLWLCNLVIEKLPMNKAFDLLFNWSRNVNAIYIIQWVLIMLGADAVLGFNKLSFAGSVGVMAGGVVLTHLISEGWLALKRRLASGKKAA